MTLIILRQTWVDTEGQEEDGHTDQPQPRHPPPGDPHHDRGVLCLGDPPSAPPSAGSILVTSLWSPWSLASGNIVTGHILRSPGHIPGRCSGCSLVSALHWGSPGCWQLTATCQWLTRPGHPPHNTASTAGASVWPSPMCPGLPLVQPAALRPGLTNSRPSLLFICH